MVTPPGSDASRVLRYQVVKDLVLRLIADQGLQPGDRLPSSTELAQLAGVSQISVRRALDELERTGRIQRHQGVGTFVASPRIVSEPARTGALLATLGDGRATEEFTTELLSLRVAMPGATIAAALAIEEGQPVWEVSRRRLLGGTPVILERAVMPLSLIPSLDDRLLAAGGSLYDFVGEKYGLVDAYEEQYLEVTVPSPEEREGLRLPAREQVVAIRGVSFDESGTAFDAYQQVYPARRFAFYVSGVREHRLLHSGAADDWAVIGLPGT